MSNVATAVSTNDRFQSPRPAYVPPSNPLIAPTLKREETKPLIRKDPDLVIHLPTHNPKKERKSAKKSEKSAPKDPLANIKLAEKPRFTMAHVLSDEEFIKYTVGRTFADKGMKALFYANGGFTLEGKYATPQLAFDALRAAKIAALKGVEPAEYKRVNRLEGEHKVYVPGGTFEDTKRVRERATEVAKMRADNQQWLGVPVGSKGR